MNPIDHIDHINPIDHIDHITKDKRPLPLPHAGTA